MESLIPLAHLNRSCPIAGSKILPLIRPERRLCACLAVVACANLPVTSSNTRRSEYPELTNCHERSQRIATQAAPLVNGFFRPEEKHVVSGKYYVIPPLCCSN